MEKTPVTIITGYLGAGKTTLLRNILAHAQKNGPRIAIIMNEFGAIAVDSEIIKSDNLQMIELAGGCVCCSLTGEFNAALQELLSKRNPPEHIVVETTGLAEPDALVVDLQEASDSVRLDSVVTVVDCDALVKSPSLGHTGRVQVEMADLLLLNKVDVIPDGSVEEIRDAMEQLNERAVIIECVKCEVDPLIVLESGRGPRETLKSITGHAGHANGVVSFVAQVDEPLSEERFNEFVYGLPKSIYRSKGFVVLDDGRTMLFNYVAGRSELEDWEQDKNATQLVFIGPMVTQQDRENVEESLLACAQD